MLIYDGKEPHEQHYIMVGDQIKYEPAWALNVDHKATMKALNTAGNTRTLAGFRRENLLTNCKTIRKVTEEITKRPTTPTQSNSIKNKAIASPRTED